MQTSSFVMILYDAVPARRFDWGTILSPENLVPDGFIIISLVAALRS